MILSSFEPWRAETWLNLLGEGVLLLLPSSSYSALLASRSEWWRSLAPSSLPGLELRSISGRALFINKTSRACSIFNSLAEVEVEALLSAELAGGGNEFGVELPPCEVSTILPRISSVTFLRTESRGIVMEEFVWSEEVRERDIKTKDICYAIWN